MPRNNNGTYSLPVSAFVPGTTISSVDMNSDLSDIASALTDSLSVSGKGGMSSQLYAANLGSSATPDYSWGADSDTGIYLSGAGQMSFSHNGNQYSQFNSDGSVSFANNVSINGNLSITGTASGLLPPGMLSAFAGSSIPTGWLLCYGQAVSRTTYAALFAVISTTYGVGDGTTTFNLPDLRGRSIFGLDNMGGSAANRLTGAYTGSITTPTTLGGAGGQEAHTVTIAEMPSHNHSASVTDPGHAHTLFGAAFTNVSYSGGGGGAMRNTGGDLVTSAAVTGISVTIGSQGSGNAHNTVPPGMVVNWIIKT